MGVGPPALPTCAGVTGLAVGDAVGYVSRSHLGGSFAEYTAVQAGLVTKLPQGVSTQAAAAVLLQGLTALSMVKTTCQVAAGTRLRQPA
jgi:NADPH2:quinone reductase